MNFWNRRQPLDFTLVSDQLFVGVTPRGRDYEALQKQGVQLFINMRVEKPTWPKPGMLWIPSFDSRLLPIRAKRLMHAVKTSQAILKRGGKVYIYCRHGRHRSVVMAAALLIAQGQSPSRAMQTIKDKRLVADPEKTHIRKAIYEFADYWKQRANK